jgi:hypothetical protein
VCWRDVQLTNVDMMNGRCSHTLPVGGSIDTSSAIIEIEITQLEGERGVSKQTVSRCVLVDVPAVDPLIIGSNIRKLESVTLNKVCWTTYAVVYWDIA